MDKEEVELLLSPYIVNNYFFSKFFPSVDKINFVNPQIPYANNTFYYNIIEYGLPNTGKTVTANSIVGKAIEKYGAENVNATYSKKGNLEHLIERGLQKKMINILFSDNATLVKQKEETLFKYFTLRDVYHDKFNLNNGYILNLISVHRLHGTSINVRSTVGGIIIRDISLDKYDARVIKGYINDDEVYDTLNEMIELRDEIKELMSYSVFVSRKKVGILKLDPYKEFYFKEPVSTLDLIRLSWTK